MDATNRQDVPTKKFGVALFDFTPSVPEELNLLSGDVVSIQNTVDDFWFHGKKLCDDTQGQFPKEFVKQLKLPSKNEADVYYFALDTFYPETNDDLHFQKGDIVICDRIIDDSWASGYCENGRGMFPLNYVQKLPLNSPHQVQRDKGFISIAIGILPLTAQLEEELSFDVGDEIGIIEVLDDGWYKGQIGTDIGIFPSAFVKLKTPLKKPIKPIFTNDVKPLITRKNNNISSESSPQQLAVTHGNEQTTPAQLLSSTNQTHSQNNNNKSSVSTDVYQHSVKEDKQLNYVKEKSDQVDLDTKVYNPAIFTVFSLHNFVGKTSTELAFGEGARIDILEESDEHWYIGRLGIRVGYVPRSYVSKVNPTASANKKLPRHASFNSPVTPHPNKLLHSQSESNIKLVMQPSNNLVFKQNTLSSAKSTVSNPTFNGPSQPANSTAVSKPLVNGNELRNGDAKPTSYCDVLFDYISQGSKDLTVAVGEKLQVCGKYDENWTEVVNKNNDKGIVPSNYIRIINTNVKNETKEMNQSIKNPPHNFVTSQSNINNNSIAPGYEKPQPVVNNIHRTSDASSTSNNHTTDIKKTTPSPTKNLYRHNAFSSPRPFQAQHQGYKSINTDNTSNEYSKAKLSSSSSVPSPSRQDAAKPTEDVDVPDSSSKKINNNVETNNNPENYRKQQVNNRERRSKSFVNTEVIDKHLLVWQSMYDSSSNREQQIQQPTLKSVDENSDNNVYETPTDQRKFKQRKLVRRSASMKERTRPRQYGNNLQTNNFSKINSDSKLNRSVEVAEEEIPNYEQEQENLPSTTVLPSTNDTVISQPPASASSAQMSRIRGSLSTSTGSSDSLTSFSDSRHSTSHSETSGKDSSTQVILLPSRAPPPLPVRKPPPPVTTTLSPPPPRRKQSLPSNTIRSVTLPTTRVAGTTTTPPARPAPMRPKTTVTKKPPSRPFNPPRTAASPQTKSMHKLKVEKMRADIEEYCRMKSDLEHLYGSTTDGKERREISENLGFVKTNLKRLQTEFQNLIKQKAKIKLRQCTGKGDTEVL